MKTLTEIIGQYNVVVKYDVTNLAKSEEWYVEKLGLKVAAEYSTPTWRQLFLDPNAYIGLNLSSSKAEPVLTLVVLDIVSAREKLELEGISVTPIEKVGDGVSLCFFKDSEGNALGLRQNSRS